MTPLTRKRSRAKIPRHGALTQASARCDISQVTPSATHASPTDDEQLSILDISQVTNPEQREAGAVARFRQADPEGWTVAGTVSRGPKGLVISHLEIWPGRPTDPPSGSVTSRLLQSVRVGKILAAAQAWIDVTAEPGLDAFVGHVAMQPKEPARPGRAPLTDKLLREVAEAYIEETRPGKPRGAVRRLAAQFDKPFPTVSRWVARSRETGWLGPASQGREGGEPGPLLREAYAAEFHDEMESDFRSERGSAESEDPR